MKEYMQAMKEISKCMPFWIEHSVNQSQLVEQCSWDNASQNARTQFDEGRYVMMKNKQKCMGMDCLLCT